MEFTGHVLIAAPPGRTWEGLGDTGLLRASLPGCEAIRRTGPGRFQTAVTIRVAPLWSRFQIALTLEETGSHACKLMADGRGGAAGFLQADAELAVAEAEGGSRLSYRIQADLGGRVARLDPEALDTMARQLGQTFLTRFTAALTAPAGAPLPAAAEPLSGTTVWMGGLVAVAAILGLFVILVL